MEVVRQLKIKQAGGTLYYNYEILDATARAKVANALYSTAQNLDATQLGQVYENLDLDNCATLEYEVVE